MVELRNIRRAGIGLALAATLTPAGLAGQGSAAPADPPNRQTVVAGEQYRAGWFHRLFLGSHYRDLWATPVTVDVLDLSRFAGGLKPTKCGGRRQTKSLRFKGKDGRQYVSRSIDKDPTMAMPPELRATFAKDIIQDQISSALPGGALVVAPLLDTAGVLHAEPQLILLPDDQRFKAFECVSPGFMLGMIEERPTDPEDDETAFAGAADVVETKKLFDLLEDDSRNRVDSREFLAARLMDVLVGDWDRHADQWKWARFDEGELRIWHPIPTDRDQAFSKFDGALVWLAGFYWPEVVSFGDDYPNIIRLTRTGRVPDRRLLVELEKPVWDSIAQAIQLRLTDAVIEGAVRKLPPEYYSQNGAWLAHALRRRRDDLGKISDRYYAVLSDVVDIHTTDKRDVASIDRLPGGHLVVQVAARPGQAPYYRRTFKRRETHEVRLYLHGGDDQLVVRGADNAGPRLRVIGGGGDDELTDSSQAGTTHFYDSRGNNSFVEGHHTTVNRRDYKEPPRDSTNLSRPRDWGSRWLPLVWLGYGSDLGLFVGAGADVTNYGFRRIPYQSHMIMRAGWATSAQTYRAEFLGKFRGTVPGALIRFRVYASGLEVLHFYGHGNETLNLGSSEFYKVRQQQYVVTPALEFHLGRPATFTVGPVLKFSLTKLEPGTFIEASRPYGIGDFGQLGAAADFRLDIRDHERAPRHGIVLEFGGSAYAPALDVISSFGEGHAEARVYVTAPIPLRPTLALRAGGKKLWGAYPFNEAAVVGGPNSVRGFVEDRFSGDAAVYGNVELRLSLAKFTLLLPATLGVFGLGDVGRIYQTGETSDRWHGAVGGGVWLAFLNRSNTVALYAARSVEGNRIYARAGFAY